MLDRDSVEAIKWADLAADLAARFGDVSLQARALNTLGSARIVSEVDIETGRDNLEQSLALARQAQIDSVAANAFNNLGSGFGEIYQFDLAERYLTEGVAFTGERDLDRYHMYMTAWLALTYMYQGRWTDAAELANAVIRKPELAEITRTMALLALGRVRARRGDPEVWPILDEAVALAQPTGTLQRIGPVRAARAEAAWLAGDSELAGAEARAGFELATRQQHRWHIGELGYWAWVAGVPLELPPAAVTPFTRQMGGDWSAAAEHWRELGCPYESARALAESDSQDSLRTAFTTFDELGARPAAAMTAKRLRDLGATAVPRGARSSTRSNPARLTTRETEVLAVIVEGRTNAEIAQRLFLSPKTVQRHVTSILGKLGVDSRREAARMAVQRSLVPMERIETARR
jgi:DNA-binding CsgD family transcriptional regulator